MIIKINVPNRFAGLEMVDFWPNINAIPMTASNTKSIQTAIDSVIIMLYQYHCEWLVLFEYLLKTCDSLSL